MASGLELIRAAAPSRLYAATGGAVLSLLAAVLLIRWGCGAFSPTISSPGYALCIGLAGLFCCSLKLAAEWPPYRLSPSDSLVFGTLTGIPLLIIAITLLSSQWTHLGVMATAGWLGLIGWFCTSTVSAEWLRWVCGEVIWPEVERFLCPLGQPAAVRPAAPQFKTVPRESLISLAREPVLSEPVSVDESEDGLVCRLQRRSLDSGVDLLEGQLTATFDAGAKQTVLHIPFTPPFSAPPHIDCEIADGSDVRIKVGAVFTYGARLELKRTTADLPQLDVTVDLYAEHSPVDTTAAS